MAVTVQFAVKILAFFRILKGWQLQSGSGSLFFKTTKVTYRVPEVLRHILILKSEKENPGQTQAGKLEPFLKLTMTPKLFFTNLQVINNEGSGDTLLRVYFSLSLKIAQLEGSETS